MDFNNYGDSLHVKAPSLGWNLSAGQSGQLLAAPSKSLNDPGCPIELC